MQAASMAQITAFLSCDAIAQGSVLMKSGHLVAGWLYFIPPFHKKHLPVMCAEKFHIFHRCLSPNV